MRCPWGKKAFKGYLGEDRGSGRNTMPANWCARARFAGAILVDQGLADKFLAEQLYPEVFEAACRESGQTLTLRRQEGYDHGYFLHFDLHRRPSPAPRTAVEQPKRL